tara:strand:+ start:527 stop:724 length:198 start_codon:yes stop_codon:yes gene_type:complete
MKSGASKGAKKTSKTSDLNQGANYQARKPSNMPGYVYDSIQRQYKGGKDYTIEDKKNVINWYKKV